MPEKLVTVPNGAPRDVLEGTYILARHDDARSARSKVVYAGIVGYNQGLKTLVDTAAMLPEIDFVLAGDGPELQLLKKEARKRGTANVCFRGYLNREDLLKLYTEADVLFAKVRSSPTLDATAVPSKLFEYMATGKPLVYAGNGVGVDFLNEVGCVVIVPPEDPEVIAAAIGNLLQDPGRMRLLGNRGREFVRRNYLRDKLMQDLAHTLKERFGR